MLGCPKEVQRRGPSDYWVNPPFHLPLEAGVGRKSLVAGAVTDQICRKQMGVCIAPLSNSDRDTKNSFDRALGWNS